MKRKYTKILLPVTTGLFLLTFAINAVASVDSRTASEFSQYCSQNQSICSKLNFNEARVGTVNCPNPNQVVGEVYVHAGDGQTVYQLPHSGFDFTLNGNSATVTLTSHQHNISWIGLVCTSSQTQTPTPTPTPTPSSTPTHTPSPTPSNTPTPTPTSTPSPTPTPTVTPSPTPTPSATPSPTPTPTPTVTPLPSPTPTPQILGVKTPTIQPETGVSTLAFATMFGAAPFGIFLRKCSKSRKQEELGDFAKGLVSDRNKS